MTQTYQRILRPSAFEAYWERHSLRESTIISEFAVTPPQCATYRRTFQILFYAIRPAAVRSQKLTGWHYLNLVSQLAFDVIILQTMGRQSLIYFILSSFLAGSLHPCASHFIAEHYVWDGTEQETYSYYGPLNALTYNVCSNETIRTSTLLTITDRLGGLSQRTPRLSFRSMDASPATPGASAGSLRYHSFTPLMAYGHLQFHLRQRCWYVLASQTKSENLHLRNSSSIGDPSCREE